MRLGYSESMVGKYSVAKNTGINAGAALASTVLNLLLTALLAHGLSREQFGTWAFLMVLTFNQGYFGLLDGGMSISAMRRRVRYEHVDKKTESAEVLATLRAHFLFVSLAGSIVLFALGGVLLGVVTPSISSSSVRLILATLVVRLFIDTMHGVNMMVLESESRYLQMRILDVGSLLCWTSLVALVLAQKGGLELLSIAATCNGLFLLLASSLSLRHSGPSDLMRRIHWNRSVARDLWTTGKWVALQRMWGVIYAQMDRTILAVILGVAVVGDYEIPYKFQALGVLLLSIFPSAIFPSIAKLEINTDRQLLTSIFHKTTRWTVGISVPLILTGMALSEPLIKIWVGISFTHLHNSVSLFLLWPVIASFHVIGAGFFAALGKTKESFILAGTSIIVNLVLSILLAAKYGLNGVIFGTVMGYLVVFLPYLHYEQLFFGNGYFNWFKQVVVPLLPALIFHIPSLLLLRAEWNQSESLPSVVVGGIGLTILSWSIFVLFTPEFRQSRSLKGLLSL